MASVTVVVCRLGDELRVRPAAPQLAAAGDPKGGTAPAAGVQATAWQAAHPSGAPALALRLVMDGKIIAYTGDTEWTDALTEVAAGADLLIAEAYYRNKAVPYHLRLADIESHRAELASRRIVLTHMSADMLAEAGPLGYECASDGMTLRI